MARPIVIWPDKVLTTRTNPVTDFGPALEELLVEMDASVREAKGVGLAANQIGVPLRVALVATDEGQSFFEIVNPEILEREGSVVYEEGCLSVPDEWERTPRAEKVKVKYQDRQGNWHELAAEGRLAHILQHEIDHLNGTVYVNHLSSLKQSLIRGRMMKLKKLQKRGD